MKSARHLATIVGLLALVGASSSCAVDAIEPAAGTDCRAGDVELLTAQTVAGATYVPCLTDGLEEWSVASTFYGSSGTEVKLVTERMDGTWNLEFGSSCEPGDLPEARPVHDFEGQLFRRVDDSGSRYQETAYLTFEGGCVVSDVDLPRDKVLDVLLDERDEALHLVPRTALDDEVARRTDGKLSLDP